MITLLRHKRIVLAVTGSIASYKAVDLASKLTQAGARVDVIVSDAARQFVTPLTFESVTGRAVYTSLWGSAAGAGAIESMIVGAEAEDDPATRHDPLAGGLPTHIAHVGLGESADLIAVVPATANTIARLAIGLADDLLTVTALAARGPILIAPAMDGGMYQHAAVQANLHTLIQRGALLIEPDEGRFASGLVGKGRLPETSALIGHIRRALGVNGPLAGRKIVITAGGTREPIDPVRFVSNRSSGKQGYAIAQAAIDAGAREVVLISTVELPAPVGSTLVAVETARQMHDAALDHTRDADALIMAAAVADFRPAAVAEQKIKKRDADDEGLDLSLVRNPDILLAVRSQRETGGFPRRVIGFAAESEHLLENARAKLERKGLDLLVANDITASDAGFAVDTNRVVLIDAGGAHALPLISKAEVGEAIITRVAEML
jgi:phosphopantothenoylcysteine decarboxylase/phosphopantothenate--cysteine ligase